MKFKCVGSTIFKVYKVIDKTEFNNVHLSGIKINAEKNEDKSDNMARQKLNAISLYSITSLIVVQFQFQISTFLLSFDLIFKFKIYIKIRN